MAGVTPRRLGVTLRRAPGATAGSEPGETPRSEPGAPARSLPVLGGVPAHVVSHASGGRDLWSDPLDARPEQPDQALLSLLSEVLDPELPISLVDLGLIYGARMEGRVARIELTYTATACPCMEFIREDVHDRLTMERWIDTVEIHEVWDPPWARDMISERGRRRLRELGVGA